MSLISADLPDLSLIPGDEDIRRAFDDADAKLSAFVLAVAEAQAALTAQPAAPAVSEDSPAERKVIVPQPVEAIAPAPIMPIEAAPQPTDPAAKVVTEELPPVSVVKRSVEKVPFLPVQAPEPQPAKPAPASVNEDDALLASLDPETAKAIRVMRRLSIEKKSVRELLEEFNATHSSAASPETRKKSWWSRG